MTTLEQYIVALVNLNGVIEKEKVLEIFNSQQDFDAYDFDSVDWYELEDFYIVDYDKYFVHDDVLRTDYLESLLLKKSENDYYIPHKDYLTEYVDIEFFEVTEEIEKIAEDLQKLTDIDDEDLGDFIYDLHEYLVDEGLDETNLNNVNDYFEFEFDNSLELNDFISLVKDFNQYIRRWEYNGFNKLELNM